MTERRLPVIDGLLAATALVQGLTSATRNVRDVSPTGVRASTRSPRPQLADVETFQRKLLDHG
jgi:hypothetical protein